MLSHGLFSLLALSAVSTASPISLVKRSSLIPTPPPACIGKTSNSTAVYNNTTTDSSVISNVTAGAYNTNLTDSTYISNVTSGVNTTTTTCLIPASQFPTDMNSTDLSNMTSIFNCTDMTNSTDMSNSTETPPSSNTTDASGLTPPDNSTSTDTTDDTTDDTADDTTDDSTGDSTSDPSSSSDPSSDPTNDPTDTSTNTDINSSASPDNSTTSSTDPNASDPPIDTPPTDTTSSDSDTGSSGTPDGTSGEFTADTTDPEGRRRRSLSPKWVSSWTPHSSHYRRIVQADLPAVAQNWQDLCLDSGGDIFTNQPCVELAGLAGLDALLSTGGVCDQQDVADQMIDFANSAGITNGDALIAAAIAYRQHPRNADNIDGIVPSTPYCTKQPRNPELVGIVNEQLPGVEPGLYGGPNVPIVAFGKDGTCPAGMTPDVSTCSCA